MVIIGGGIAGLVLALALHKHTPALSRDGIEIYEQSRSFTQGTGGAIGMYPNGLRVIRDISPSLLCALNENGYPYIYRRWMRHDGTQVAVAKEEVLLTNNTKTKEENEEEVKELQSIGIRRWKLQKVLYDAAKELGIPVHFQKRLISIVPKKTKNNNNNHNVEGGGGGEEEEDSLLECNFADGTTCTTSIVFGCDGVKSKVREYVVMGPQPSQQKDNHMHMVEPQYTGVTCLMGASDIPRPMRGICFPSSSTTKCHACYYPTSSSEQIFQIYFPTPIENPESWGTLSEEEGHKECMDLATKLEQDGWDGQFILPLKEASSVVRVGLRAREPLSKWTVCDDGNTVVLLGDAAHPPVPYIGQGAQMAIEDAGVLALLLKYFCCDSGSINKDSSDGGDDTSSSFFDMKNIHKAIALYEQLRIDRTKKVLGSSHTLGKTQQDRAENWFYNITREWSIKLQVLMHGTLPIMYPGARYNYKEDVERALKKQEQNGGKNN